MALINASPLVFLGNAGKLELLHVLSESLFVPRVVLDEVTMSPHGDRAAAAVQAAPWLGSIDNVEVPTSVARWGLDAGEEQVVAAGLEMRTRVVIDDLAGRRCALAHHLDVVGTLGIAVAATRRGLIDDLPQLIAELRASGMYLSDAIIARALELAAAR